jgi:hypothetical protein
MDYTFAIILTEFINLSCFLFDKTDVEQTLHTDSFSSSLSLVGKFAGELGVRLLTVVYGKVKNEYGDEKRRKSRTKLEG